MTPVVPQAPDLNLSTPSQTQLDNLNTAYTNAQASDVNASNVNMTNQMAAINNAANASGLLYSTMPAYQQTVYNAATNLPALNKVLATNTTANLKDINSAIATANQIVANNAAAAKLNAM